MTFLGIVFFIHSSIIAHTDLTYKVYIIFTGIDLKSGLDGSKFEGFDLQRANSYEKTDFTRKSVENYLNYFREYFFSLPDFPHRTKKHVSSPTQKSTCKRLNMFLRWMVRDDQKGVDFGIWKNIKPSQLICPTDLHVERVARKLKLITRKQVDWQTASELTHNLQQFDPNDPVKYDFALFGLGIYESF